MRMGPHDPAKAALLKVDEIAEHSGSIAAPAETP
jgi:hypothetical protein